MIVYLSGPISGKRDKNRRAFEKAQKNIEEAFSMLKIEIISPLKIAEMVEFRFDEINRNCYHAIKPQWPDYMRADLQKLCDADCVYFLKEWEKSKGATLEHHIAETLEIPCAETIEKLLEIRRDGS